MKDGWLPSKGARLPGGLQFPDGTCFQKGALLAIVTEDETGRFHLSVSLTHRLPTYDELKDARYALVPHDKWMVQVFPPPSEFINIHPYVLHLWELPQPQKEWTRAYNGGSI